jgi:acyl carrier protein
LVDDTLGDRPHRTVALENRKRSGLAGFLAALAQLAVAGVDLRTGWLFQGRRIGERTTGRPPGWTIDGQLVRLADGSIPSNALHPAHRVTELTTMPNHVQETTPGTGPDALVAEFLRTSREMVAAQRDVLLGYFGAEPRVAMPSAPSLISAPGLSGYTNGTTVAETHETVSVVVAEPPAVAAAAPAAGVNVMDAVLAVIAERTGYPVDLIEPGLDLEADLSVDSIKRTEIAGELALRLNLPQGSEAELEELSKARTATAITDFLTSRLGAGAAAAVPAIVAAAAAAPAVNVMDAVLAVIAERTGYPVDLIEPGLDLEADLSVDSIKRTEIAGELALRLNLPQGSEEELEEMSKARTAMAITDFLTARLNPTAEVTTTVTTSVTTTTVTATPPARPEVEPTIIAPQRLEFAETPLSQPSGATLAGSTVLLLGGGAVAEEVAGKLTERGATPVLVPTGQIPDTIPAGADVLYLDALEATEATLPTGFPVLQAVLTAGPRRLVAADQRGTGGLSGLRGFIRSVDREYPDLAATVVEGADVDALIAELAADDGETVVLSGPDGRRGLRLNPTDLGSLAANGAGPAGDGAAEAAALGLDRDSVILLVGGARGITARFARTLAATSRCRIELVGRTPVPGPDADTRSAAELRTAFIAEGGRTPAQIEKEIGARLAEQEVRGTIETLRELGSQVRYHSVDMRDDQAVLGLVKEIRAEHGRLDGLVYAAGVIEDKLIAEKSAESFSRVFQTKVDGARTLLDAVAAFPEGPRFAVLFGSIAAALGNRGQSDYAAANDALEDLAERWSTPNRRGLTVHWGPWAPTGETNNGMVTPELMRNYAARGIGLIDPEEGTLSLLRELAYGPANAHAVVYTASGW